MPKAKTNGAAAPNGRSKSTPKSSPQPFDILTASPQAVGARVDEAIALIQQAEALLAGLIELSDDERRHTAGRLRDGESAAITAVLDAADANPGAFAALAEQDHGTDATRFETQPTRDDLARREHLARLVSALGPLTTRSSDTLLAVGTRIREVSTPAYAIARIAATVNPKLRSKLAPATSFYSAPARKAQKTKKGKQPQPA